MILDTSAILAILFQESNAEELADILDQAATLAVATATLIESGLVLGGRLGYGRVLLLHRFLQAYRVREVPFEGDHWTEALEAYRRFGKGRHKAALNFGDCISYATAKLADQPLLCVGNDFIHTDLALAYR